MKHLGLLSALLFFPYSVAAEAGGVPVIYSTDLFHPPGDPDDQVDLATLFALPELDIRAVILDCGHEQGKNPGLIPLRQIMHLSGRQAPHAIGLGNPLRHPEDTGRDQFPFYQAGPELILNALRESKEKVFVITVGSLRDVMAAYNREPRLLREKIARIYVNAGNSMGGDLHWNPRLDPQAYIRLMQSDLPVYWLPCFGTKESVKILMDGHLPVLEYQSYWKFRHQDIFEPLAPSLQNYFLYALGERNATTEDPVAFLSRPPNPAMKQKIWPQTRNMWSTASFIHVAGRKVYRRGDSWAALREPEPAYSLAEMYDLIPASVSIDRDLRTSFTPAGETSPMRIFRVRDLGNYQQAMTSLLQRLLMEARWAE